MKIVQFTVVAILLASPPAMAFYKVQYLPKPLVAVPSKTHPGGALLPAALRMRQIGAARAVSHTIGFGHLVPLRLAGPMILPPHWRWRIDDRRIANTPVSWRAGEPWTQALLQAPPGVRYVVDWDTRTVAALAWPPVVPVWRLTANRPLRAQIIAWGRTSGWTVIFHGHQDWIVPAPATFKGNFASAVEQVVHIARAEGAVIHAYLYAGNNTVVIREGK